MTGSGRQFRFIRAIAAGGFGTVYLCKEEHASGFSQVVAIKLLNAQWSDSDEISSRIRDEARLLGLLRHRNIVNVLDLTSIQGRSAVIMEYLEAVDLRFLCRHCKDIGLRLPVRPALEIIYQVATALDAAYNRPPMEGEKPLRVIHRDIKPSNIMLDAQGVPKVLDFGVAQSDIASKEANTEELQFGSVDYMAPERLFFEPETPASDVYSLAATLFEILTFERLGKAQGRSSKHQAHLTNRLSFLRGSISVASDIAADLENLLLRALDFAHENRPDAATFSSELKQLARRISDEDLVVWAEHHLPSAVQSSRSRAHTAEPLSNSILVEDRREPVVVADAPKNELDIDTLRTGESARAAALRRGALAELNQPAEPAPATSLPEEHSFVSAASELEADDWNDRTVGELTDVNAGVASNLSPSVDLPDVGPPAEPKPDPQYDEMPEPFASASGALEHSQEHSLSITEQPQYDTMDGLDPVKPKASPWFIVVGIAIPLMIALVGGAAAVLMDFGGVRSQLEDTLQDDPTPVVESNNEAAKLASAELAKSAAVDGVRFVSKAKNTKKLRVKCSEGKGKGEQEAVVPLAKATECSITAIRSDMSRVMAVVPATSSNRYICFENDEAECLPQ